MIRVFSIATVAAVVLSGCASLAKPSIRSALVDAGARPRVANCMAERMTDRLSIAQLQKLKRLKAAPGERTNDLSAAEIIERAGRIDDPEVIAVTASAGAVCAVTK